MVYPLVDFLFIIQHNKRLWGNSIAVKDETEVAPLAFHVSEVYQGCIQSAETHREHTQRRQKSELLWAQVNFSGQQHNRVKTVSEDKTVLDVTLLKGRRQCVW